MDSHGRICSKFKVSGTVKRNMCIAYESLSLPLYPSEDEVDTYCMAPEYRDCPLLNYSVFHGFCNLIQN